MKRISWVFIDTHERGTCRFGLLGSKVHSVSAPSSRLLPLIAKEVGLHAIRKSDGVCVVAGPGSFSSVRAGVLVANLIARLFQKPLVGVSVEEAADAVSLQDRLADGSLTAVAYVAPVYDAEPNITVPTRSHHHP